MDTYINRRVLTVYKRVMAMPEGPSGVEYRRDLRKQVRALPQEVKDDVLSRSEEIEERSWEEFYVRKDILLALGFTGSEAQFLARCRLNSPGIRELITQRVNITRFAKPQEIKDINAGYGSIVRILEQLYIKDGGIE